MSLRRNIIANFVGQFYVTLIGIFLVPLYIKYMGAEAYGLVGFYAMLQAWFILLDMGLTPTMSRETARFNGGASDALTLRQLLRSLEYIFVSVAIIGAVAMIAGSGFVSNSWLKVQQLPLSEVQNAVILIAIIVALRWICGLYRGAINGFERIVWLNCFNIIIATIRFALIIPFLIFVGATPTDFFSYQLVVAIIEVVVLVIQTYRLMPKVEDNKGIIWEWKPLRSVLKFSLTIAFTSGVWVLVTQTDKLILSGLISLADYGYFTLAVLVASGILTMSGPVSGALLPRMTKLEAKGDASGLIQLYRKATQIVAIIVIPASLVLALFSEQILWAWTGNTDVSNKAAPVLTLYALGNGVLAMAAFPYYLQFAKGDLKLHLIGNVLFVLIFIPLLIFTVNNYGMKGAGYAWLIANLVPFIVWVPIVHRHFLKGLHTNWLLKDVMPIAISTIIVAFIIRHLILWPDNRLSVTYNIIIVSILLCVISTISSSWGRSILRKKFFFLS